MRAGRPATVTLRVPPGADLTVRVRREDGGVRDVEATTRDAGLGTADVHGGPRTAVELDLPTDLPLGYHTLEVDGAVDGTAEGLLAVAPPAAPLPEDLPRAWGWMLQVYALLGEGSWGIGDLADLRTVLTWSAERGAHFAVANPLHAQAPVPPVEPSPYFPSSRRFHDPLMLRVEEVPEVAALEGEARDRVAGLAAQARPNPHRIDRDAVQAAKMAALGEAFAALPPERHAALEAFAAAQGPALRDFATFCAIGEIHGVPFGTWPAELRHPDAPAVAAFRERHAERVSFHMWLQMLCNEQLEAAQGAARDAGMRLGVVHDLAVGVDAGGADAWALQDEIALGVTVGAPPDYFNQQGQDWAQPPLLPNRLPETGFAPFRDMLAAVLRHAGGIRIDHVMGLFRLFWIPEGATPAEGTYVRYPSEDMLGILALEAHRADAVVVGEDLGTVEPGVRETLSAQQVLGSQVLYFERDDADDSRLRPASAYRETALASVSTHDLPTAAGWWTGEDVRLRTELGLLGEDADPAAEWAHKDAERGLMHRHLREAGLVGEEPTLEELIVAMHAFLAETPSRLVAASLHDAVGDRRQPNLPGTVTIYPNWRLPLAVPDEHAEEGHRELALEEALAHPLLERVVAALETRRPGRT